MKTRIFILFLNFVFCIHSIAQISDLKFTHIENPTQTTTINIKKIFRDSKGFLWFITEDGLYMYNGYDFTEFKYNPQDSNSLCNSHINDITEDNNGYLFIATIQGLSIYSHDNVGFKNYRLIGTKNSDIKITRLKALCKDAKGKIWIGTEHGLIKFGGSNNSELFLPEPDTTLHNNGMSINTITTDSNNNLWMCTWGGGLLRFNIKTKTFKRFIHNPDNPASIPSNIILNISVGKEGIWIDSQNKGLFLFDPKSEKIIPDEKNIFSQFTNISELYIHSSGQLMVGTKKGLSILSKDKSHFRHYVHNPLNPNSISYGSVTAILEDNNGTLWIGTTKISKYNPKQNKFTPYYHEATNPELQDYTKSIAEDKQHNVWIGTFGQGIKKYTPELDTFQRITTQNPKTSLLPSNFINAMIIDNKNQLWIGTSKGICIYDLNTNKFLKTFEHNDKLLHINIYYLFQDKRGIIWICTQEGAHTYNPATDKLRAVEYERKGFNFKIHSMAEDKRGNVWLGTDNGLIRYNKVDDKFTAYYHVQNQKNALSNNKISKLFIDNNHKLWIATQAGLNLYLPDKEGFKVYNKSNGFADEFISNILHDEKNNIWCVTPRGAVKFNPQSGDVKNYDLKDGARFNKNGILLSQNKKFLLGGAHRGFYVFHPDSIKNNITPPPVYITKFNIFNKPVKAGKDAVLKKPIITTKQIVLSYKQSVFSFGFAALNYIRPEKNRYAYKMKGFDDEWRYTNSENRIATYTNLAPGEYTFRVIASNNDGIWNEEGASIKITITPPWWQTLWFRITLFITIAGSILGFYFWRVKTLKARQRELEKKVDERTAKLQEANLVLEERQEEILQQSEEILQQSEDLKLKNKEISKAYNNIQIISEFGQKISASLNLESINKMMYNYINSLMDTDVFGIGIYNDKKQRLEYHSSIEAGEELPYSERTIHKKNSLSIWCFSNQKTVFINNLDDEYSKYISKKPVSNTSKPAKSLVHIPLTAENKKIGIISINSFRKNAYSKTDLDNLQTLASYLAIALDNANAYTLVHRQNEHIQSAIHYAQTIQESILPLDENLNKCFESFILFRPKDVVSGDFYWFYPLQNKNCLVAVVDCTGHGVPGAFMSLIGNRILTEIVEKENIYAPAEILNRLDEKTKKALRQDKTNNNDGMDIALARITYPQNNSESIQIAFAGAKRKLFIKKQENDKVTTINGTRKSIGGIRLRKTDVEFMETSVNLSKGDMIYLTSDGYIDQNNRERQRFGSQRLMQLFTKISNEKLTKQKQILENALDSHQQQEEQRDDITIWGIRL